MHRLTSERMGEMLADLCAAFGKPYGVSAKRMIDVYLRVVGDYPPAAVEWAVAAASRESEKFPRPVKLRELCARSPYERPGGTSLADEMRAWESNPWIGVDLPSGDRPCRSNPCPVCGSVVEFSDRGAVIVHDDRQHIERRISYSNLGRSEWFEMGPPVMPEKPKARPSVVPIAWATLNESMPARKPSALVPPVAARDENWDVEQQERAAAEQVA